MKQHILDSFKRWGIAFILGGVLGAFIGEVRYANYVKKDCEVIGAFRQGEVAYQCRQGKI